MNEDLMDKIVGLYLRN